MQPDPELMAKARAKLKECNPEVRHDARNLLTVYVGMSDLADCIEDAHRRLPALENKIRHFIETGELLKNPLTNGA
jgi:hypothetical protein